MSKKTVKKEKKVVIKPYNSGTMTTSAFWSFIRSCLRQKSRYWKPIQECKKLSRRPNQGSNKKMKFEYQCAECKNWFPEKEIAVDHILPAGSLNNAEDLPGFVTRLFCETDNLRVLCEKTCHSAKTIIDKENIKQSKLNKNDKEN